MSGAGQIKQFRGVQTQLTFASKSFPTVVWPQPTVSGSGYGSLSAVAVAAELETWDEVPSCNPR